MIYLDTSVLGALFFREPTAPAILAHLETADKPVDALRNEAHRSRLMRFLRRHILRRLE